MATKKQKREAAQAKRAAFEAEVKADGLKALARAKKHEDQVRASYTEEAERINKHRLETLAKEAEKKLASVAEYELGVAKSFAEALYVGVPSEE